MRVLKEQPISVLFQALLGESAILYPKFGIEDRKLLGIHDSLRANPSTESQKRNVFRNLLELGLAERVESLGDFLFHR